MTSFCFNQAQNIDFRNSPYPFYKKIIFVYKIPQLDVYFSSLFSFHLMSEYNLMKLSFAKEPSKLVTKASFSTDRNHKNKNLIFSYEI